MQTPIILVNQSKRYLIDLLDQYFVALDPELKDEPKAMRIEQIISSFREKEPVLFEKSLKYIGYRRQKLLTFLTEKGIKEANNGF